ncbi:MAG: quinone oxidoreductase [Myxococcales bacterium]|nr:quinone oxidoreductase [Myxococcales bacterium]MDH5567811.1 quinone oxidoreductase [Myxococcales bacterium]
MKARAITVHETGGANVLQLETRELPAPGAGEVQLRVSAIGVNFIDVYFRTGLYPRPLPFVPGLEGAGVIERLGPDVEALEPGARVAWASVPGSYAERLIARAADLVRIPDAVSDTLAAAVMLQGMTAHYLAHGTRSTRPGDVALVHAAAGGTGLLLVQQLKAAGATVLGTCSSAEKEALAREAGADHVIRYTETDFAAAVRAWTHGRGVDVVYDSVGSASFDGSLACLRPRGLLVLFGQSSGPVPAFDLNRLNTSGSLFITRPSLFHYLSTRAELEERAGAVLEAVAARDLRVRIHAEFPLAEAAEAQRALEGRRTAGKLLLRP